MRTAVTSAARSIEVRRSDTPSNRPSVLTESKRWLVSHTLEQTNWLREGKAFACITMDVELEQKQQQPQQPQQPQQQQEPKKKGHHHRRVSSLVVDETKASSLLTDVLRENNVFLGGSSLGKGLKKAAHYYFNEHLADHHPPTHLDLPGRADLADLDEAELMPLEDSFYVVDIAMVVSQVYQWRRFFPRVEPFYAVKCNPDPVIVKTLAIMGCNFDCASRNEIRLVQEITKDLRKPEIIYANPCKARNHLVEAVCRGVRMVTFDNATEVLKCAQISKKIELILRIITDDRGSQCRLSSKFGAPRIKWRALLAAAKKHGLQVVGVSFHVGSGCRDASRYEAALADAREIFDMAKMEFGFDMTILDIGGGFPGETHSLWNPASEIDEVDAVLEKIEGIELSEAAVVENNDDDDQQNRFMYFKEIAAQVAPVIDRLFPIESGVRVIGEPGRYFVAACSTLCCSVVACRNNAVDASFEPERLNDAELARSMNEWSREEEHELVHHRTRSLSMGGGQETDPIFSTIQEELADYSKLYATQMISQQEFDVYNDKLDLYKEDVITAVDLLGPPEEHQLSKVSHSVEGMAYPLVANSTEDDQDGCALLSLAAAGEAAVNGIVMQAVADSAPLQDDYSYYINDGVYGAFNNIMFDHASCRPRVLRLNNIKEGRFPTGITGNFEDASSSDESDEGKSLYASTVFGPTCDSIDVIARSVLLPKLNVGDYLYFTNMGAYTMAAASSFNGFTPSEKIYVCSVQPQYFEALAAGPEVMAAKIKLDEEEKKVDSGF
ncbi:hypothetical protein MPSEU_000878100 [Mayamaea pseudoterrestris]|nr:hypothetical protein MPSEU_000878100 [Mayamaea pseudoterrestris]